MSPITLPVTLKVVGPSKVKMQWCIGRTLHNRLVFKSSPLQNYDLKNLRMERIYLSRIIPILTSTQVMTGWPVRLHCYNDPVQCLTYHWSRDKRTQRPHLHRRRDKQRTHRCLCALSVGSSYRGNRFLTSHFFANCKRFFWFVSNPVRRKQSKPLTCVDWCRKRHCP